MGSGTCGRIVEGCSLHTLALAQRVTQIAWITHCMLNDHAFCGHVETIYVATWRLYTWPRGDYIRGHVETVYLATWRLYVPPQSTAIHTSIGRA